MLSVDQARRFHPVHDCHLHIHQDDIVPEGRGLENGGVPMCRFSKKPLGRRRRKEYLREARLKPEESNRNYTLNPDGTKNHVKAERMDG